MLFEQLIQAVYKGGTEGQEAALALGLLIEREKVYRPNPDDDGGIREILGSELSARRLSDTELTISVDKLLQYIDETSEPEPMAVWALTKSNEERILPQLIALLDKNVHDVSKENLTYQALLGIINIGILSNYKDLALKTICQAAEHGHGQVLETATQYLEHYSQDFCQQE